MTYTILGQDFPRLKLLIKLFKKWLVFAETTYYSDAIFREIRTPIFMNHDRQLHNFSVRSELYK
jgi:hypothetical protein